jgi:methylated-DNA-[protein]-cysteine S-methyltransferase
MPEVAMYSFTVRTPFSNLGVITEHDTVVGIEMIDDKLDIRPASAGDRRVAAQLERYCNRPDAGFDLDIELRGTPFQKKVWRAMQKIPPGKVKTYGELARKLATSPRAVGNACRSNNLLLVVPCHRVVSSAGLGGFHGAARGRWPAVKRQLLAHEGVTLD